MDVPERRKETDRVSGCVFVFVDQAAEQVPVV
jgi:hypothetical protein